MHVVYSIWCLGSCEEVLAGSVCDEDVDASVVGIVVTQGQPHCAPGLHQARLLGRGCPVDLRCAGMAVSARDGGSGGAPPRGIRASPARAPCRSPAWMPQVDSHEDYRCSRWYWCWCSPLPRPQRYHSPGRRGPTCCRPSAPAGVLGTGHIYVIYAIDVIRVGDLGRRWRAPACRWVVAGSRSGARGLRTRA